MLVCLNCVPILCVLMCDCPLCPFSLFSVEAVFVELQQAGLITPEEYWELGYLCDVVRVQSGKSPEVQTKTVDVFRRYGFEEESNPLAGEQM